MTNFYKQFTLLILFVLLSFQVKSLPQVYSYSIPANQAILLDNHVDILGGFQSGITYSADVSGNPTMPMQGAFIMYIDDGPKFTYTPSGSSLSFKPEAGSYKFAPFLVDWSTLVDNTGNIQVDLSDGRNITLPANQAILLDDYPQFPILGGFEANKTYIASVTGNPQMPMQGVFVMYIDNNQHKFTYVPINEELSFTPGTGSYKFCAFQVDWSTLGDNFGSTTIVIDQVTGLSNENSSPHKFILNQNYPNPFNPSTLIKYQILELSFVTLTVFDVLGNQVATLVNEEKPSGTYEVEFNAIDLPSGIYFYQLRTGNFVETKKMTLMK